MNPTGIPDLPRQLRDENTSNQEEKTETKILEKKEPKNPISRLHHQDHQK